MDVHAGDTILLFSDGIEDQLNKGEHHFTRTRGQNLLKQNAEGSPQDVANAIFDAVDEFRDAVPLTDDQTVVVLKVV